MKNLFIWCIGGLLFGLLNSLTAQDDWNAVALSDTVVSFGAVNAEEIHSMELTITNKQSTPVQILSAVFEEDIFSTNLTPVEIVGYAQYSFNVYFNSKHNVNYTDFLSIELDAGIHPLIAEVSAQAVYTGEYYSSTQNKWAEDLKLALTEIIDDHNSLSYNTARDSMYGSIDNKDGWVECVYTGRKAYFNDRPGANDNNFNCEHTWPQSFFNEDYPMKSDIFHLYPTDITANSQRGSFDFGIVTNSEWSSGGSKKGTDSDGLTVFEPRDVHKGNVARSHFYFIIRYNGLYDEYQNSTKMESHFRDWHTSDIVDDYECQRNENIYDLQHNRNPFIDHPEFVERISSFFGTAVKTTAPEIAAAPVEVDLGKIGYNYTACYYIAVINTGGANLNVSSISSTNADFQVDKTSMNLNSEFYEYVKVSFTSAETEDVYTTNIRIESNDDDESLIEIPVTVQVSSMVSIIKENRPAFCYHLYQNYPNPFNSQTTISFSLASAGAVKLAVYNINGQLVQVILDNLLMSGGAHKAIFDANSLPSGIYYYRLTAGKQSQSQKLILIK
jgi:endonuclease I